MEDKFIEAIRSMNKISVTYFKKKDESTVTRTCAPMDIGPHKRFPDKGEYYQVWDYDGSNGPHPSPLKSDQIISVNILSEKFDPSEFVTWQTEWTIPRDWGQYS